MGPNKDASKSKALSEFLSEAQDILEGVGNDLMQIDKALKGGEPDPDLVNNVFRGMHTLKSLSGMFGVEPLSALAHKEESLLEEIRLGRRDLRSDVLDLLFESIELMTRILAAVSSTGDPKGADDMGEAAEFLKRLDDMLGGSKEKSASSHPPSVRPLSETPPRDPRELFDAEVLEVLTEYEEHRLKLNLERGMPLRRIAMRFELESIDTSLEAVRSKLKPIGEIITYLPSPEEGDPDKLGIDIILALHKSDADLREALGEGAFDVHEIKTKVARDSKPARKGSRLPAGAKPGAAEDMGGGGLDISADEGALVPVGEGEQALSLRSVSQTVRVDIRKLDRLMNVVGELAIVRRAISRITDEVGSLVGRGDLAIELHRVNRGFDRRLTDLRDGILEVRMVPLGQVFDRLARLVRKIARGLNKDIHLVVSGAETEVDKLIVEELSDPLMHIVRNAIDHGVEDPEDRQAVGKPAFGTVALTAYQKGNHVMIEVEDDGAGIDVERLVEVAVERGVVDAEQAAALSSTDSLNLIFLPGVSTAKQATELSGRGVGMDVVKTNIAALGGVVEVQTEPGIGTKFSITLPVTLAIIPALLVVVSGRTYAIPLNTVAEAMFVTRADIHPVLGTETMTLRSETLPLLSLDAFFGDERTGPAPKDLCVVVTTLGQRRLGLIVDSLTGQQDVVIKTLGKSLSDVSCFSGATDIGDDRLALVLDTAAVIEEFFSAGESYDTRPDLAEVR